MRKLGKIAAIVGAIGAIAAGGTAPAAADWYYGHHHGGYYNYYNSNPNCSHLGCCRGVRTTRSLIGLADAALHTEACLAHAFDGSNYE